MKRNRHVSGREYVRERILLVMQSTAVKQCNLKIVLFAEANPERFEAFLEYYLLFLWVT